MVIFVTRFSASVIYIHIEKQECFRSQPSISKISIIGFEALYDQSNHSSNFLKVTGSAILMNLNKLYAFDRFTRSMEKNVFVFNFLKLIIGIAPL